MTCKAGLQLICLDMVQAREIFDSRGNPTVEAILRHTMYSRPAELHMRSQLFQGCTFSYVAKIGFHPHCVCPAALRSAGKLARQVDLMTNATAPAAARFCAGHLQGMDSIQDHLFRAAVPSGASTGIYEVSGRVV